MKKVDAKKNNRKKKVLVFSLVIVFLITISTSLYLFLPRDFSYYFVNAEVVQIQLNDEATLENKNLNDEEIKIFFDKFKKAKYVTNYFSKKTKSSFSIRITSKNGDVVTLTRNQIEKNGKVREIHVINVELYDIYFDLYHL